MDKLYNVGFLRIVFTLIIIILHLHGQAPTPFTVYPEIYSTLHLHSLKGYLAVEIFFIISGFFLFFTAKKDMSTKDFFINRLQRLWFVPAFAIFCIWILSLVHWTVYSKYANILHLAMLKNTGLTLCLADNGTAWFVSTLFWVSVFYYYLIKNFERKYVNLVIALIVYFSLLLLVNGGHGYFKNHYEMLNPFFNVGMLRGLASIGIGYFIAMFTENVKTRVSENNLPMIKRFTNFKYVAISALEIYLFVFLVQRLVFKVGDYTNDLVLVIMLIGLFVLFIFRNGFLSQVTNHKIFYELGKYTFSIYIMQEVVFRVLRKTLWINTSLVTNHPAETILITLLLCCLTGVVVYYIVEVPTLKMCKNGIKSIFAREGTNK